MSANVVHFSVFTFTYNEINRFAVIFYIKPVAYITAVTVFLIINGINFSGKWYGP